MRFSVKVIFGIIIGSLGVGKADAQFTTLPKEKLVIYQLLPRYFGNQKTANIPYGTIEQNGVGKFNDITDRALEGIKELHVNYVWYTGVISHATLTDYSKFGLKADDADVVKGRAGSPYAIRDYYDVDPDLAVDVAKRMQEYESLITRTHKHGLKVMMDFIPNHVSRTYQSNAKPAGVVDFGADDDKTISFSVKNDFYYVPGKSLIAPENPKEVNSPLKKFMDGKFDENPAKATGNNVFSEKPSANDWYETVKLNYGVEYKDGKEINHFNPVPPVWIKMRDILIYWTKKGVDGFRCDVAEFVPVEFWEWALPQVRAVNPNLIFMAEAYNPKAYETYLTKGKFDYLYDKVGLYDGLKRLIKNDAKANVEDINYVVKTESAKFPDHMVRFLENHDEERIAAKAFAGDAKLAIPAMVVTATLGRGPVMLYYGQEVGEQAGVAEGFSGDDDQNARTTIFEYWGVPYHQKWMNNGKFDGATLSTEQKQLRAFYQKLMAVATQSEAIKNGDLIVVKPFGNMDNRMYAYVRSNKTQHVLVVANFSRDKRMQGSYTLPNPSKAARDLLSNKAIQIKNQKLNIDLAPNTAQIISF